MRVLFVFPGLNLGGAERQGLHLARYLAARGAEVLVLGTARQCTGRVVEICRVEGFPCEACRFNWPCRKSSLIRDGFRFLRTLRRLRPDVILSYCKSPNIICGLTWRWTGAKACIWGQRNVHGFRGTRTERLAYRHVSAIICNASHEKEHLEKSLGPAAVPLHIIHNGIELPPPQRDRAAWRRELDIPDRAVVVTMLANFRRQKDHGTLLRAWAGLLAASPDQACFLVLAGAPQFTFEQVRTMVQQLKIEDTIRFPGSVEDVAGLLQATDIGVLSTKHEGLPNAILEYMSSGLPVLASDVPGNREALGPNADRQLCRSGDPKELTESLFHFVKSPDFREQLGRQNRERACQEFSVETMCRSMCDVIRRSLAETGMSVPLEVRN